jgi:DNA polymerase-3 subunit alpha
MFRLEDQFGAVRIICWPEQFGKYRSLIQNDAAILVKGRLELSDEGAVTIVATEVQQLESARARLARRVVLIMPETTISEERLENLNEVFNRLQGEVPVLFEVLTAEGNCIYIRPNQFLRVSSSQHLTEALTETCQDWKVEFLLN